MNTCSFFLKNITQFPVDTCHRNLCELGYNGAVWGKIGEAVVEVIVAPSQLFRDISILIGTQYNSAILECYFCDSDYGKCGVKMACKK